MTITEHKLNIIHQIEELSEESLIEVEKLIATLKVNQNKVTTSALLIKAIKDFRVNKPVTQIQIKELIEEGRE